MSATAGGFSMLRRLFARLSGAQAPIAVPEAPAEPEPPVAPEESPPRESLEFHIDEALSANYAQDTRVPPQTALFPLDDPWPDDPGLGPRDYDRLEIAGTHHLPISMLRAFRPATFDQVGFPTRIAETAEILRYADWNVEGSIPKLFERGATHRQICYVNAFSFDEWALMAGLAASVARMTAKRCGRAVRPVTTAMMALTPFRIVQQMAAAFGDAPRTIFEVGPGTGYLGPLVARHGHRYRCFDVTQAFCLWQHHMLRWTAGNTFAEMIGQGPDEPIADDKLVVNLPWWRYSLMLERPEIAADFVYSNANLSEMSNDARRCMLEVSLTMLRESPIGLLFYIGAGHPAQCTPEQLDAEIRSRGFTRVENLPFTGWVARPENVERLKGVFADGIRHHNPSGRPELYPADIVMRIPRAEAPLDIAYARWVFGWEPPYLD